ncbi:hypothetical protein SGRA_2668 [Saprospira grandis str. Lewin]|uniref:Uncharacterized protein n=1 Tax=Saprospira grandis (strain Lewin) TaxID=984262 RepID=H6L868_SAPGL|nr:hypothetical protein SGRA_2668 [Saprospira grandis str. Lewin]
MDSSGRRPDPASLLAQGRAISELRNSPARPSGGQAPKRSE